MQQFTGNLGVFVRAIRVAKNLSLRQLSLKSGVSASTICRFENGDLSIKLSNALAIFHGLEMEPRFTICAHEEPEGAGKAGKPVV